MLNFQAVTAGFFYHTARFSKGGQYKTVKHQQTMTTMMMMMMMVMMMMIVTIMIIMNHICSCIAFQAVTAGFFYHTARFSKGGQYKTVKHQQTMMMMMMMMMMITMIIMNLICSCICVPGSDGRVLLPHGPLQ